MNSILQQKVKPYFQALPYIFDYQIVTKIILGIWLFLLGEISQILLKSSGRVAITSGDWQFLFTTWQGILLLVLGLVSLFVYVAFDLNTKVIISRNIVTGKSMPLKDCMSEGFRSMGRFTELKGLLIVLYIALIAPILGIGLSVPATQNFYIPTFIASFIEDSVLYSALAGAAVLILLLIGIMNLFILHGIVIDGLSINEASRQSRSLIKNNWKDYIKQNILFILGLSCIIAAAAVVCLFIPLKVIELLPLPVAVSRLLTIGFAAAGVIISALADLFAVPVYMMKMTQLYYSYKEGRLYEYKGITKEKQLSYRKWIVLLLAVLAAVIIVIDLNFDQLFPVGTDVKVVAHRAGGNEAAENTVAGIETAWKAGAYGSEIDIQRTKDGHYVINHDGTFKRVAGEKRKPEEMTLSEIRKLSVDGEPVPTLEEMLEASKDKLVLFIELKGATADKKMADDAVALVKQYGMESECVMISLKYDIIDYIENKYPEIQTGFLTFLSIGGTAKLNCDYLGLEEESATADAIRSIHDEGKKVLVWTANEKGSQRHFLCSDADGIITDNVTQARKMTEELKKRSDVDRMVDKIKTVL